MILQFVVLFLFQWTVHCSNSTDHPGLWCGVGVMKSDEASAYEQPQDGIEFEYEKEEKYLAPPASVPYNIHFVFQTNLSAVNREALTKAAEAMNKRLSPMMKAVPLPDVRRKRRGNKTMTGCEPCRCQKLPVPGEYSYPCKFWRLDTGDVEVAEAGVPNPISDNIRRINEQKSVTLVVFVYVQGDGLDDEECRYVQPKAYADRCQHDQFSEFRPTHGLVVFCRTQPKDTPHDGIVTVLLHETLHIITAGSLANHRTPRYGCFNFHADAEKCERITWRTVNRTWLTANGTVKGSIHFYATTPSVTLVAKWYFNCPILLGAEFNAYPQSPGQVTPSPAHWIGRIFPEEIMAPRSAPNGRISKFTLAALKDSGWYEVDMDKSEPMVATVPRWDGCKRAKRSCWELIKQYLQRPSHEGVVADLAPYCAVAANQLATPRCSPDGKMILECSMADILGTHDCPSLQPNTAAYLKNSTLGYDSVFCEKATHQAPSDTMIGGTMGADTMCITFLQPPEWARSVMNTTFPRGVCVQRTCDYDTKKVRIRVVHGDNKKSCEYPCTNDLQDKVVRFELADPNCKDATAQIVCPKFDLVCPPRQAHVAAVDEAKAHPEVPATSTAAVMTIWEVPFVTCTGVVLLSAMI